MRCGPVPVEIHEMLEGEPCWLAELGAERCPWSIEGFRVRGENEPPDLAELSQTDRDALVGAFARARSTTFDQRTAASHGPDWQKAKLGWMHYEDMIEEDNPRRAEILETLEQVSTRMVP